jgi:allantoin racemase
MASGRILVINPNSNPEVTAGLRDAVQPFARLQGPEIACIELPEGPFGIESEADVVAVIPLLEASSPGRPGRRLRHRLLQRSRHRRLPPGDAAARLRHRRECHADRHDPRPAVRRRRHPRSLDPAASPLYRSPRDRAATGGERALELRVHELADEARTWDRLVEVATALRDEDKADVVILGCAGMSRYRRRLETLLGLPVIDPTQAAVGFAVSALCSA